MDFFTKERLAPWIIVLLVILNISTLTTIWFLQTRRPFPPPPPNERRPGGVELFLEGELGLTEEQTMQFEKLREEHHLQSKKIMDEIHQMKRAIMEEVFSSSPDTIKMGGLSEGIGSKQAEQEQLLFEHFLALKSVCQPDQQERLGRLMREIMEEVRPPGPPEPHRGPPPPRKRHE